MELIPAIDLLNGQCVRLVQGRKEDMTVYSHSPLDMARSFEEAGVRKVHLVNLDGAFGIPTPNQEVILNIIKKSSLRIELGGGIRSEEQISFWLNAGVGQVVLGTAAVENTGLVKWAIDKYGAGRIIIGVDARRGYVMTRGWTRKQDIMDIDLGVQLGSLGITQFIYTDVESDGMMNGPNTDNLRRFAENVSARITASGGIRDLEDILRLRPLETIGVHGVIVGKAIYEGRLSLAEAIETLRIKGKKC